MQRRLILMRHAKSSWADAGQHDRDRPLNERGRRDAPRVARHLVQIGWAPDAVWSSDARRTRETYEAMAPQFQDALPLHLVSALYLGDLLEIRRAAATWSSDLRTVLVLGHNPGIEEAVTELTGELEGMKTANAALLVGAGEDWSLALTQRFTLAGVVRPKELGAEED